MTTLHDPGSAPVPRRAPDPLSAALGNASFLCVGYWRLGLSGVEEAAGYALLALPITVVLVVVLLLTAAPWCEVVLLVWWVFLVAHAWSKATRHPRPTGLRERGLTAQRLASFVLAAVVLSGVGFYRYDAGVIARETAGAQAKGDCAGVLAAQGRAGFGHRLADAPKSARSAEAAGTCRKLRTAKSRLDTALRGDTGALREGFGTLAAVLRQPGNDKTAQVVLDGFLGRLPTGSPCADVKVVDWLRARKPAHNLLDRSAGTAGRLAPGVLAACADSLLEQGSWEPARTYYQRLLDQFPADARAAAARRGVVQATRSIERADVIERLAAGSGAAGNTPTGSGLPKYCTDPAKYSGAAPVKAGLNPTMFYGDRSADDDYFSDLPDDWKADRPDKAVQIACVREDGYGDAVQTCSYRGTGGDDPVQVTFRKVALAVEIFELRTGRRVAERRIEVGGSSCPVVFRAPVDPRTGTSSPDQPVEPSPSDVRAAFRGLVYGRG